MHHCSAGLRHSRDSCFASWASFSRTVSPMMFILMVSASWSCTSHSVLSSQCIKYSFSARCCCCSDLCMVAWCNDCGNVRHGDNCSPSKCLPKSVFEGWEEEEAAICVCIRMFWLNCHLLFKNVFIYFCLTLNKSTLQSLCIDVFGWVEEKKVWFQIWQN